MDESEKRESKPDLMDRKPNNLKLGFMYAPGERNSKPDTMDRIPNNPKLGFLYASEERNSKPGMMDRILPPRIEDAGVEDCAVPPDFIREAFIKAAKSRASTLVYHDDDDDFYWFNLEKKLQLPVGIRSWKACVFDSFSDRDIEMKRAAAEWRRMRSKKRSADKDRPILAKGCF